MPRVADLPKDWRHWSPAKKIEHPLGMSLGRATQILCWSPLSLNPQVPGVARRLHDRHQADARKASSTAKLPESATGSRRRVRRITMCGAQCRPISHASSARY
jgi:hypothetical protein